MTEKLNGVNICLLTLKQETGWEAMPLPGNSRCTPLHEAVKYGVDDYVPLTKKL